MSLPVPSLPQRREWSPDGHGCKRRTVYFPQGNVAPGGNVSPGMRGKVSWLVQGVYTSELTGKSCFTYLTIAFGSVSEASKNPGACRIGAEKIARECWQLKHPRETPLPTGQTVRNEGAYAPKKRK